MWILQSGVCRIVQRNWRDGIDDPKLPRTGNLASALSSAFVALVLIALALLLWRWAAGTGVHKSSPRHLFGGVAGFTALFFAGVSLVHLAGAFGHIPNAVPGGVTFDAPVQQASSALS